uniref:Uncharacterized protein n=1 Tax=Tetraselmis chuii TaxID=63592 RepID=A0A6U1LA12_9CHLO
MSSSRGIGRSVVPTCPLRRPQRSLTPRFRQNNAKVLTPPSLTHGGYSRNQLRMLRRLRAVPKEADEVTLGEETPTAVKDSSADEGSRQQYALEPVPEDIMTSVYFFASFMVLWCLAPFPGSAFCGLTWHDSFVQSMWAAFHMADFVAPESLMLKYNTLGQAPALLHALPGAVWCACAPLQLSRKRSGEGGRKPGAHSTVGRVMLTSAAVLMVGYVLIDESGLSAEDYDFHGHGGPLSALIDGSPFGQLLPMSFNHFGLKLIAGWFIWSGVKTFWHAKAGQYGAHRAWAVRHVGAGLWVAAQRPMFATARLTQLAVLGPDVAGSISAQSDAFYGCSYVATIAFFVVAEAVARGGWQPGDARLRS